MAAKDITVRIINPSSQPFIPKTKPVVTAKPRGLLEKLANFAVGAGSGLVAGAVIFFMLKSLGLDLSPLESTMIVALPSLVGLFTSLVIF